MASFTQPLSSGFSFDMIFVEGGIFKMSHRDTEREIKVRDFFIGKFPVTQGLYKAIIGFDDIPSWYAGIERPMVWVTDDVLYSFLHRLKLRTGNDYRLPSEAEWEFAACGGNISKGFKYSGSDKWGEVAWMNPNSHEEPKPVGLKMPNELGLYDMTGNVEEMCEDRWHNFLTEMPVDGKAWVEPMEGAEDFYKNAHVFKGGHFRSDPLRTDVFSRWPRYPTEFSDHSGFRLALSAQES